MNFPEVPFDENLFSSNALLKSYWERSTEDRTSATIPDWPSEETEKHQDLRNASKEQWALSQPMAPFENMAPIEKVVKSTFNMPVDPTAAKGARVEPKMSAGNIAITVILVLAAVLFLAYVIMSMNKTNKTVYSPRRSSPRRF